MSWPAPTTHRRYPPNVALVGGPWDGQVVPLQGMMLIGPPAIFPNGYIICVGSYEWVRNGRGQWYGNWRPNLV